MDTKPQHNADGEIVEGEIMPLAEAGFAVGLHKAELDQQITTARAFPRSLAKVKSNILAVVGLDDEAATECMYALPRAGKAITGPSIRFAEAVKQAWGNCRAAAEPLGIDRSAKTVTAQGVFFDLETNTATKVVQTRSISDKKGRIYSQDLIVQAMNAACSIAMRECILKGVPKPVWRAGYEHVLRVVRGDAKTLVERRDRAVKSFANFGVTPERVYAALDVKGMDDINLDHLETLYGMFQGLKNGEATVEEIFDARHGAGPEFDRVDNPLGDDEARGRGTASGPRADDGQRGSSDVREGVDGDRGAGVGPLSDAGGTGAGAEGDAALEPASADTSHRGTGGQVGDGHRADAPAQGRGTVAFTSGKPEAPTQVASQGPQPQHVDSPAPQQQPAPAAPAEAPPAEPTTPSTPEEYEAYAVKRMAETTSKTGLANWYKADRTLRQELEIPSDIFDRITAAYNHRIDQLEKAARKK